SRSKRPSPHARARTRGPPLPAWWFAGRRPSLLEATSRSRSETVTRPGGASIASSCVRSSESADRRYDRAMKIDLAEVRRIAKLSCLEFGEEELPLLAEQLSAILTHVESLRKVDTDSIEPTFHSVGGSGPLRSDDPRPGLSVEDATRGSPPGTQGSGA